MKRELMVRPPVAVPPGHEWWEDTPHRLAARLGEDRRVVELERYAVAPGRHGALVRRLKPRPPAWRKPVTVGGSLAAVAVVVLWALYVLVASLVQALVMVWPLLAGVAVAWGLLRALLGHRVTCAGLHCPGCRG